MSSISFYTDDFHVANLNGSGLGFFGNTFGKSVDVGEYQETTWLTNSNGTVQGLQTNNVMWTHPASGSINGAASVALTAIPNYLATLNIRFDHATPVKTQNAVFRIYDRAIINNNPSGVTVKVAELRHPDTTQTDNGSGNATWSTLFGSGSTLSMTASPGMSGLRPNGSDTTSTRHDYYVAISPSPDSVGSKLFAGYFSLEYL